MTLVVNTEGKTISTEKKSFCMSYSRSQSGGVSTDWERENVTPIFKKESNENPGNYWPVALTSVPGMIMEQILLIKLC